MRFLIPRSGCFLSPDPFLGSADVSNPQSLNRYSYVLNNVTNLVDPSGLFSFNPCPKGGTPVYDANGKQLGCLISEPGGNSGGSPTPAGGPSGGGGDPKNPPKKPEPKKDKPGDICVSATIVGSAGVAVGVALQAPALLADSTIVGAPAGGTLHALGGAMIVVGSVMAGAGYICQMVRSF